MRPPLRRHTALVVVGSVWIGAAAIALARQDDGSAQIVLDGEATGVTRDQLKLVALDCRPADLSPELARVCTTARRLEGQRLFEEETFGGNGRTCATCHSRETGTFSPADARMRLAANPADPLFRHDAFDNGTSGLSRLTEHATVRIELPLPPYVTLKDDPARRTIVVHRGTPSTLNTPALENVYMHDFRNATLEDQALGAIEGHAQNAVPPTRLQLELIAEFQRTSPRFFSSPALRRFARGGPPPELPAGTTESEQRGRRFFVEAPFTPGSGKNDGLCALCHSGPMLNRSGQSLTDAIPLVPLGVRDISAMVSERNLMGNPVYTFLVDDGRGNRVELSSPDPGELLIPHRLPPPSIFPRTTFVNFFKTPTLWGVKHTAPYFHDNSAKTLEELVEQYDFFFKNNKFGLPATLTDEDKKDIVEFLKLL